MSLSLQQISEYIIKKPFINYNLNINDKYQQNIIDNKTFIDIKQDLFLLVKNIKSIHKENSNTSENGSDISNLSEKSIKRSSIETNQNSDSVSTEGLDNKLSKVLDTSKYFIYIPNKKDSFIGSILSIIDMDYCCSSEQSKNKMIKEFREKIGFDIDKNVKNLNYKRNFKKNDIQDILLNNKNTDNNTHIYIGDVINKNIIIMYGHHEYSLINNFNSKRDNIILYYKDGIYCPLLNIDNQNFIDNNTITKIKKMYNQKIFFKKTETSNNIKTNNSNSNISNLIDKHNIQIYGKKTKMNGKDVYIQLNKEDNKVYITKDDHDKIKKIEEKEKEEEIKLIKKMKIAELHTVASKYNINIYNGKNKKLKKELMEEIITKCY